MGEFDVINHFFRHFATNCDVAVGDDCALLSATAGQQLAISSDMLVEGRHFLSTVQPDLLGHKALAVNLSDLAACGARPRAFTLALALPRVDAPWLEKFSQGMMRLARQYNCDLAGGDTTRGPLNICITVIGEVPAGQAILRSGAKAGDDLYVSGCVGDARLALEVFRGTVGLPRDVFEQTRARMEQPEPRVHLAMALRGIASSAIDISDGLLGDLGHLLAASGAGACVDADAVSRLMLVQPWLQSPHSTVDDETVRMCTLSGGDDYELLFTAPPHARQSVQEAAQQSATRVSRIGSIRAQPGLLLHDGSGQPLDASRYVSFDHFA